MFGIVRGNSESHLAWFHSEVDLVGNRTVFWAAIGVAAVMFAFAAGRFAGIGTADGRTTYLTFTRSVRLPGVTLTPGTYVFELTDPLTAPRVVRVLSQDRTVTYFSAFTGAIARPRGLRSDASVSLGESSAGLASPITAWWPIGERTGRQFIYSER